MIPKIEGCLDTLEQGVKKIHIIDGRLRHSLLLEIYTTSGVGTELVRDDAHRLLGPAGRRDGRHALAPRFRSLHPRSTGVLSMATIDPRPPPSAPRRRP